MIKKKIKRAIISVSDKSNLKIILPILKKFKIEIISSGGSYNKIKSMNYNCIEIANYTKFSEMLGGRIKTLHPKIHAGILNIRKNKKHQKEIKNKNIPYIVHGDRKEEIKRPQTFNSITLEEAKVLLKCDGNPDNESIK